MIEASALTKRFEDYLAVDGIDFSVAQGQSFGFLGPNGAGKSSTMRMVGAVSPVSGGTLRVLGKDPAVEGPAIRSRLGVVPQLDNLDLELTVWRICTSTGATSLVASAASSVASEQMNAPVRKRTEPPRCTARRAGH